MTICQSTCLLSADEAIAVSTADSAKNHRPGFVAAVANPLVFAANMTSATTITSSSDQRAKALNHLGISITGPWARNAAVWRTASLAAGNMIENAAVTIAMAKSPCDHRLCVTSMRLGEVDRK